jgi:hypothetical protein
VATILAIATTKTKMGQTDRGKETSTKRKTNNKRKNNNNYKR